MLLSACFSAALMVIVAHFSEKNLKREMFLEGFMADTNHVIYEKKRWGIIVQHEIHLVPDKKNPKKDLLGKLDILIGTSNQMFARKTIRMEGVYDAPSKIVITY